MSLPRRISLRRPSSGARLSTLPRTLAWFTGQMSYAETLTSAARKGWEWLSSRAGGNTIAVWAAAELYRLDSQVGSARNHVDQHTDWSGQWYEIDDFLWKAALAYVQATGATASTVAGMRSRFDAHVDEIFSVAGPWGSGMQPWQYYWGSNRPRALYGLFLLQAARLGTTGGRSTAEVEQRALDYLHFLHGRNALSQLYLTNMAAAGGEHSSYQIFHGWFGNWDDPSSRAAFIGRPASVVEAHYPYWPGTDNHGVQDNKVSQLGPAPGFVPGGPNLDYGSNGDESSPPANRTWPDTAYRDWADQTIWTARTWEITENSISYQAPYVALASYFVSTRGGDVGGDTSPCETSSDAVCLLEGRFEVTGTFETQNDTGGNVQWRRDSDNTGLAFYTNSANVEMVIKILDGCSTNQHFWVFAGGLTTQHFVLRVRDTETGAAREWTNPLRSVYQPIAETSAFATCS